MQHEPTIRPTIERMEEHEIIDRLKRGMFSEDARPIAEAILCERGVDPSNPVVPEDQVPVFRQPVEWKPRLLPMLFGAFAAATAGRQIGAALGGLSGAGVFSALAFLVAWWIGKKLAFSIQKISSKPKRYFLIFVATLVWALGMGFVGLFAQVAMGRIRP